jgi:hypothetical protein
VAPSRAEADSLAESAARSILIRLAPADGETRAFLEGKGRIVGPHGAVWPPDAYAGLSAMTLAALAKMPDIVKDRQTRASVSIAPLPGIDTESALDWQGRSVSESLRAVAELTGARLGIDGDVVLGAVFWKAFIRGGYQAGAWIVETTLGKGGTEKP